MSEIWYEMIPEVSAYHLVQGEPSPPRPWNEIRTEYSKSIKKKRIVSHKAGSLKTFPRGGRHVFLTNILLEASCFELGGMQMVPNIAD